jgi:hypothetical protein
MVCQQTTRGGLWPALWHSWRRQHVGNKWQASLAAQVQASDRALPPTLMRRAHTPSREHIASFSLLMKQRRPEFQVIRSKPAQAHSSSCLQWLRVVCNVRSSPTVEIPARASQSSREPLPHSRRAAAPAARTAMQRRDPQQAGLAARRSVAAAAARASELCRVGHVRDDDRDVVRLAAHVLDARHLRAVRERRHVPLVLRPARPPPPSLRLSKIHHCRSPGRRPPHVHKHHLSCDPCSRRR